MALSLPPSFKAVLALRNCNVIFIDSRFNLNGQLLLQSFVVLQLFFNQRAVLT